MDPTPKPADGAPVTAAVTTGKDPEPMPARAMSKIRLHSLLLFTVLMVLLLTADRASKVLALAQLADGHSLVVIPGVVEFLLVKNRGSAFGLFEGALPLFLLMAMLVLVLIIVYLFKTRQPRLPVTAILAAIAAGALGNAYDRITSGEVVDFIRVLFVDFPVFNLADSFLTVGEAVLIIAVFIHYYMGRDGSASEDSAQPGKDDLTPVENAASGAATASLQTDDDVTDASDS
jgi:signal peptidase II